MTETMPKLTVGTEVIVTGDTYQTEHDVPIGNTVTISEVRREPGTEDWVYLVGEDVDARYVAEADLWSAHPAAEEVS